MTQPLVSPEIAKSAEGKFLKLEADTPVQFILYKPVGIIDAAQGDNLKFFRKVNINGEERHIKYEIHLKEVATGEVKEWQVGSASAINQLTTLKANVGDTIEIEKIKLGERKQDVRYRIKLISTAGDGQVQGVPSQGTPAPVQAPAQTPASPAESTDEINTDEIPF